MHKLVFSLFLILYTFVAFCFLLGPIQANDFFWHIKTGEWIWNNGALPSHDPFAYTTHGFNPVREQFILTSAWLGQVILYLAYLSGNFVGIVTVRFLVFFGLSWALLHNTRNNNSKIQALLTLLALIPVADLFFTARPQLFSFLFFAILIAALKSLKKYLRSECFLSISHQNIQKDQSNGKTKSPGALKSKTGILALHTTVPVLMLVWSNTHAGFAVGVATIIVFLLFEGIKFVRPADLAPLPAKSYLIFAAICLLALTASLFNPNFIHFLSKDIIFQPNFITADNLEYMSPFKILKNSQAYSLLIFYFFFAITLLETLRQWRNIDISETFLLVCLGFFAFTTFRYVPFFMIASLPVTTRFFSRITTCIFSKGLFFAGILIPVILLALLRWSTIKNTEKDGWISPYRFPIHAADFITRTNLQGNMYNHFNWGGYLIWRLAPQKKVFIDSRILNFDIYQDAMFVNNASQELIGDTPAWREILKKYEINYIINPIFNREGGISQINYNLLSDTDWELIFYGFNSLVFLKNSYANQELIMHHRVDKNAFVNELLSALQGMIDQNPVKVELYISQANLLKMIGKENQAHQAYMRALQIKPNYGKVSPNIKSL